MRPELNLHHVGSGAIGYGRYGVELNTQLQRMGIDVHRRMSEPGKPEGKVCNVVCWVSVPTHAHGWWKGQMPVISTMFEATCLPESFRETLHEFAMVIVPSEQNVELFSRYHDNVRYVPLGVDPDAWHFVERQPVTNEFRFLIGGSGPRKGTDLAYEAFRKAFPHDTDGPRPSLIMKNPRGEGKFVGRRGVTVIGGKLDPADEVALYETAHCYLQPSRGEGFGLQPLQAIAQGIPTILTDAHGHKAFSHLGIGLSTTLSKADYFIYGDAGQWWEPNLDELIDGMRWVYDHYDDACEIAAHSAAVVAAEFTWKRTAERFVDAVGLDALSTPYQGPGEWHAPQVKRYRMVTTTDRVCDIAGITYHFEKGRETWELADVKRIAFEAGWLDPVCLEGDDTGLTDDQLTRLGDYTAAHSHCPTCGQRLNSSVSKTDELLAAR